MTFHPTRTEMSRVREDDRQECRVPRPRRTYIDGMRTNHAAVQDYLKAIHSLGGAEQIVTPIDIASRLQVKAPSVTGMLKRLESAGLITYGVGQGRSSPRRASPSAVASFAGIGWSNCFLTRVLGLDWSEVDAEADALEHAISPRLEEAIAAHLGEPLEDPHGHPIPTAQGRSAEARFEAAAPVSRRRSASSSAKSRTTTPTGCGTGRTWAWSPARSSSSSAINRSTTCSTCKSAIKPSTSAAKGSPACAANRRRHDAGRKLLPNREPA